MLRCQNHEGCSIKGVWSGGINGNLFILSIHLEINLCTIGFANPLALHLLYLFRPVQLIQII